MPNESVGVPEARPTVPSGAVPPARFTVDARALRTLAPMTRGRVLSADDADYDTVHRIWNHDRQRRPAAIVECADGGDVVTAIRFARAQALPFAVRGAGYTPSGTGSGDGVVADLRALRRIDVDRAAKTVTVGPGVTWGGLDRATQRHGLIVPGLPVPGIGVVASTIGGGYGMLRRAYGLSCDSIAAATVVTADGRTIEVSGDRNPELLWGLRGGGGNFGAVTSLRFRLRPLPEPIVAGACIYPAEHAPELLRFYRQWTAGLRDDVTTRFSLLGTPHALRFTPRISTEPVVAITVVCVGPSAEANRLVQPLREAAPLLADRLFVQPYIEMHNRYADVYPPGSCAAVASEYLAALDDATVDDACRQFARMPQGACEIRLDHMGGAVGRVPPMATAVPHRDAPYLLTAMARWAPPAPGGGPDTRERALRSWLDETRAAVRAHGVGGPHIGMDPGDVSGVVAYGGDRYLRLSALKQRFDPDNVFARNLNIVPFT